MERIKCEGDQPARPFASTRFLLRILTKFIAEDIEKNQLLAFGREIVCKEHTRALS